MPTIDLGPLAPLIEAIPEQWRPWVITAIAMLAAISVTWQVLSPLRDLVAWLSQLLGSFGRWLLRLFKRRSSTSEDVPPPEPIPDERTIWETRSVASPVFPISVGSGGIPVVTIANMKGGVGKTTLTANLAAYFQDHYSKPVLVIDFDYQGSLSETLWKHSNRGDGELRAHTLLTGHLPAEQAQAHARTLANGLERVELYPSRYPFATIENNIMVDWLKSEGTEDIRFRLCRLLREPAFQGRYSIVLIDSPPRLTTGAINALCASTHLLIPTKLDEMSAEAAVYFLQQIQRMKDDLFPALQVVGIVPTMTQEASRLADFEQLARDRLMLFGEHVLKRDDILMMEERIPEKTDIARSAGVGVAYLRKASVRPIFERLGRAIVDRLK